MLDAELKELITDLLTKYAYDFIAPSGLPVTMLMTSSRDTILEAMENLESV